MAGNGSVLDGLLRWGAGWIAAGAVFLGAALYLPDTWMIVVAVLIGLGLAARGLLKANQAVGELPFGAPGRLLIGIVIVAAGVALVLVAFGRDSQPLAAFGVAVAIGGLVPLTHSLFHYGRLAPPLTAGIGLLVGAAGVGVALFGGSKLTPVAVLLGIAGFLVYRLAITPLCNLVPADADAPDCRVNPDHPACARARLCARIGVVAIALGVVCILAISLGMSVRLAALAAYLVVFGFVPLSIGWPITGLVPISPRAARWAAPFAAAGGALLFYLAGVRGLFLFLAVLLPLLLGVALVWRGEGYVIALIIGIAVVWVVAPRIDQEPLDPHPEAAERILLLGDSFSSGEGAESFFDRTSLEDGATKNTCRRSSVAYGYQVAKNMSMGLDFFACSGAKAVEIHQVGQMVKRDAAGNVISRSPADVAGNEPQLDNLDDYGRTAVVLLTIGGNDASFGDIGGGCIVPGSCEEFRQQWLTNLDQIQPGITEALVAVRERVGADTPVVVLPYPSYFNSKGCDDAPATPAETRFLAEFLAILQDRVRTSALQAGVNFFPPGLHAYDGARICDAGDWGANLFHFSPIRGSVVNRLNPTKWWHGSLHPNARGHALMADALEEWLTAFLADVEAEVRDSNPPPRPEVALPDQSSILGTVAVNLPALAGEAPARCVDEDMSPFATARPVLGGAAGEEGSALLDDFPLDAEPQTALCFTRADGSWGEITVPSRPADDDARAEQTPGPDEPGTLVYYEGGTLVVRPEKPEADSGRVLVYQEESDDTRWQVFTYTSAADGARRLLAVDFCSANPDCHTDVERWRNAQIVTALQRSAVPALLLFLGGWLSALGWKGSQLWDRLFEP